MGTIRNEMTIVHHWDKDKLEELREDAIKVFSHIIRQDAGVEEYIENMIYNEELYKSRIYFHYKWRLFKNWMGNV